MAAYELVLGKVCSGEGFEGEERDRGKNKRARIPTRRMKDGSYKN